jgi:hypothetical protein
MNKHMMLVVENRTFENATVYLTGHAFLDCTFRHCTLVYRGEGCTFSNCTIDACIFHIDWLVTDHRIWAEFLTGFGRKIVDGLPRPLGDKK